MRERADPATPNPVQSATLDFAEPEAGAAAGITAVGQELAAAFREVFGGWCLEGEDIVARPIGARGLAGD